MTRRWLASSAIVAALALPSAASAAPSWQPPVPSPAPVVVEGPCPGMPEVEGCYLKGVIYLNSFLRVVRTHEAGHYVDARYLDQGERNRFQALTNNPGVWNSANVEHGASPSEQFADAYAHCRLDWRKGWGFGEWEISYFSLARRDAPRICGFIKRAMLNGPIADIAVDTTPLDP